MLDHILFLLLGLVIPAFLFVSSRNQARLATPLRFTAQDRIRLYYGNGLFLYGLAALCLLAYWWQDRPLTELGLGWGRMPYDVFSVGLLVAFVVAYLLDGISQLQGAKNRAETRTQAERIGFLPRNAGEFTHWLFLALAAGVGEEIVYRGFLINYFTGMLPQTGWAAVVAIVYPAVVFALGHFYQGTKAVIKIVGMAIIFGVFFYRTGSLWPLIMLHVAVDVVAGLASWYLLGRPLEGEGS